MVRGGRRILGTRAGSNSVVECRDIWVTGMGRDLVAGSSITLGAGVSIELGAGSSITLGAESSITLGAGSSITLGARNSRSELLTGGVSGPLVILEVG